MDPSTSPFGVRVACSDGGGRDVSGKIIGAGNESLMTKIAMLRQKFAELRRYESIVRRSRRQLQAVHGSMLLCE